jgi:RimJ/RimL family protein N-acetyltransferase
MLWLEVRPPAGDQNEELDKFVETFAGKKDDDPRSHLLTFEGARCVGRLGGTFLNPKLYFVREITAAEDVDADTVALALGAYLAREFFRDGVEILTWDKPEAEAINDCLRRSGFVVDKEKAFVKKNVQGFTSPHEDPFSYRTLAEIGDDRFIEIMVEAATGDPFEDPDSTDPREEFQELVDYAGNRFDPTWWRVAYLDDRPVGIVLPQEFDDREHEGSLFYVGVLPEFRGRGFGKILHAGGLAFLAQHGVTDYIGSTDTRNHPMMRVFEANGCNRTGTQLFYKALRKDEGWTT